MAARTYYRRGEIVPFEEDIHHEFKGHRTVSIDNRLIMSEESVGWGQGELGEYSTTRQQWSKYLCGMINTGLGGTLYGGIQDDGRVTGFMMTHYQQDHVRVQLEDVLERFDPPVVREQYMVRFVPIVEEGEEYLARPALLDSSLEKFGKTLARYLTGLSFLQIITICVPFTDVGVTTRLLPLRALVPLPVTLILIFSF